MNQILGQSALAGFLLALAAHVCVLLGIDVADRVAVVWALDTGMFALFAAFLVSFASTGRAGAEPARSPAAIPSWVLTIGLCLAVYAFANSAYFVYSALQDGNPELAGGKYLQVDDGKVYHLVALTKYDGLKASALLVLSGHWLLFYFIPFAWFTYRRTPDATG